jgi:hypothetical protein
VEAAAAYSVPPTAKQPVVGTYEYLAALECEVEELRALQRRVNTPEIDDFIAAIRLEAVHQVERWGEAHDQGKTAEDWFWTLGYLATKAVQAARYGDREKYLHHIVTSAALLLNWHRAAAREQLIGPVAQLNRILDAFNAWSGTPEIAPSEDLIGALAEALESRRPSTAAEEQG